MSKTNPRVSNLITQLETTSHDTESAVWRDIADRLAKPRRSHAEVNLGRIERYAREDHTVVVPGKVLGSGILQKPVTIAAVDFSQTARRKIEAADGTAVELEEMLADNPNGQNIQVIG